MLSIGSIPTRYYRSKIYRGTHNDRTKENSNFVELSQRTLKYEDNRPISPLRPTARRHSFSFGNTNKENRAKKTEPS